MRMSKKNKDVVSQAFLEDDATRGLGRHRARQRRPCRQGTYALEEKIVTVELRARQRLDRGRSQQEARDRPHAGARGAAAAGRRLLVEIVPRHGAQITEINVSPAAALARAAAGARAPDAADAARRATAPERAPNAASWPNVLEAVVDSGGCLVYLRYHFRIKRYIAECARNPFAARAIAPLLRNVAALLLPALPARARLAYRRQPPRRGLARDCRRRREDCGPEIGPADGLRRRDHARGPAATTSDAARAGRACEVDSRRDAASIYL